MATVNGITTSAADLAAYSSESTREVTQELGKDEFLQILVTQMQNQDPLEPMQDTEFIAQMAQFSSLEQMQQLNTTFTTTQAYSLIGKNVVGAVADEYGAEAQLFGRVTGVIRENGTDYLQVGSYILPLDAVSEIYDTGAESNSLLSQSSNLIGKSVEALVPSTEDASTAEYTSVTGTVESILVKEGTVYAKLSADSADAGKEVPVSYITKIN